MIIDISYPELSFLRELVSKEQYRIWGERWASRLPKDTPVDKLEEIFNQIMIKSVCDKPLDDRGCCVILLRKFQEKEDEMQKALKVK